MDAAGRQQLTITVAADGAYRHSADGFVMAIKVHPNGRLDGMVAAFAGLRDPEEDLDQCSDCPHKLCGQAQQPCRLVYCAVNQTAVQAFVELADRMRDFLASVVRRPETRPAAREAAASLAAAEWLLADGPYAGRIIRHPESNRLRIVK